MEKRALVLVIIGIIAAVYINNITGSAVKTFCDCVSKMDPVCSLNETTYLNKCVADCFSIPFKHKGACNICGDGICDNKESQYNCPIDCRRELCNNTAHPYGYCIGEQPFYCTRDGELIANCTSCGCPFGQYCITKNNTCAHLLGMRCKVDETEYLKCSVNKPFFCNDNDKLIERCDICGCPKDMACGKGAKCVPSKCEDYTEIRKCSPTKPKYCFYGQLIERCGKCGCPDGLVCRPDGVCFNKSLDNSYYDVY